LQAHAPHWQLDAHVSEPFVSHACVAFGAHAPWPPQADHADHVPLLHVRVSVPQSPHACDVGPLHVHWPLWQLDPPGHALLHAPQLLPSVCSATHVEPHSVYPVPQAHPPHWQLDPHVSEPLVSHACVAPAAHAPCPPQADHADHVPLVHVRVWVPQLPHASVAGPLQTHWPDWHVDPVGQALPQAPQLLPSLCSSTQAPAHIVNPVAQAHAPHWHPLAQDCDPLPSQPSVAPGAHAPWPVQADQADHVPPLQVRVWVPQLPQACDDGPLHVHWPLWQLDPVGHTTPQPPQWLPSLCSSTHAPPHAA
jgi:hypothetical protein